MSLSRAYLALMAVLLLGYAFLDKGFAYLGYAPIYVGEMVLAVGLLVLLCGGLSSAILRSPITWAILAYAAWGAFITLLDIGLFGLESLRNSVVWTYSAFALLVAGVLLRTRSIERSLDWYGRWLPWFIIWVPIGLVVARVYMDALPLVPGSKVRLLTLKSGDLAVHLAGAMTFLALGLHRWFPQRPLTSLPLKEFIWWGALSIGLVATGSQNRGGLLAILTALTLVMVLRPMRNKLKNVLLPAIIVVALFTAFDVKMPLGGSREMSPQQILDNVQSIFILGPQKQSLSGTVRWRREWWNTILDYTVFGDHFWSGKGYGVNLAVSDGFYTGDPNRSPHNGHMTILARSGVPGLVLWIVLQGTVFVVLLRRYFRADRAHSPVLANANLWVLAYWTAFIVNMSFDVYLEGPQGGIWFWSLVGFAIALTVSQPSRAPRPISSSVPRSRASV